MSIETQSQTQSTTEVDSDSKNKRIRELRRIGAHIIKMNSEDDVYDDLSDAEIYNIHTNLLLNCANSILKRQNRTMIVDEYNRDTLRFLLYYFNNCPLALEVFPDADYSLKKNIFLYGAVGVGKTLIMDAFSMYLRQTANPRFFYNISQTQMLNYYKQYNSIDKFTFNQESNSKSFDGNPVNLCINDIGLQTSKFYGQDTKAIIDDFIYSRYEIWASQGKQVHITTNLDKDAIKQMFYDEYGRIADRFKMFNLLPLGGISKR